jgi:tetratricopeptide (TPR) repeat protein
MKKGIAAPGSDPGGDAAARTAGGRLSPDSAALLAVAVLVALTAAIYSRTFSVPLLYDDIPAISENPTIGHWRTALFPPPNTTASGRPFLNLSFALNHALGGEHVWSYHATNLANHCLAAIVLYGIVRRTAAPRFPKASSRIALASSMLWAAHPLQTESVTYLVQRAESLMGLLYLATLYFFVRAAGTRGRPQAFFSAASLVCCALGMATKEVMATAPLVVLLYDRTFLAGTFKGAWTARWRIHAGLMATWILLALLVLGTHGRTQTVGFGAGVSWWSYGLTQCAGIVHYLKLCFWPHPLVFDYGSALVSSYSKAAPYVLVVAGFLFATFWALVKRPVPGFLGAAFFLILAPSSSVVPIVTETLAEQRMYLPLASVVVATVLLMQRFFGRMLLFPCTALALALGAASFVRNGAYSSELSIWSDTVSKRPENWRAQNNLGTVLTNVPGSLDDAERHLREAIRLNPNIAEPRDNLGVALLKVPGREAEAIAQFEEAIRLNPRGADAYYNLALALERDPARAMDAISNYREALRLDPDSAEAHYNLAVDLDRFAGDTAQAIYHYNEAIHLKPAYAKAHLNLGAVLAGIPGRETDAIAQYKEAIRLDPGSAEAHANLGLVLAAIPGRVAEAVSEDREAIRLKPDYAGAYYNLGNAFVGMPDRISDAIDAYRAAIRLRPAYAEAHNNLGAALASLPGRTEEAIAEYKRAISLKPDYADAHLNLGSELARIPGRMDEAVSQCLEAIRLDPKDPDPHFILGSSLAKIPGRADEAALQLRETLRLQPGNEAARRILNEIAPSKP